MMLVNMTHLLKYLIIIISILAGLIRTFKLIDRCKSYHITIISRNCGGCGLCQSYEIGDTYLGFYCDYEYFKNIFIPESKKHCQLINNCKNVQNECNNFPCVPFLGTFKCKCNSKTFGQKCQYSLTNELSHLDYAIVENIFYTPLFIMNRYLVISVLFSHIGKHLEVHVETLLEKLVFNSSRIKEISFDESYCKFWFPDYLQFCNSKIFDLRSVRYALLIRIPFPGREFRNVNRPSVQPGNTTKDQGFIIGKIEKVKLQVYNNKISDPVMDTRLQSSNLFVSPEFSVCEPHLKITYTGITMFNPVLFARKHEIFMTVELRFPLYPKRCRGIQKNFIKTTWKFWKMDVNHDELGPESYKEVFNVNHVKFEPYSLDIGKYKSRFNVTVQEPLKSSFTVMYAYFDISLLSLEAVIEGGDVKTVYMNTNCLVLSGAESRNPNLNEMEQTSDLRFQWECDGDVNCRDRHENKIVCDAPFENVSYNFTLTIFSKRHKINATATQQVIMQSSMVPSLEILCKQNCGNSGFKSNPHEIIYLEVLLTTIPIHIKINNMFVWKYSVNEDDTYKSVESIRQPNTQSKILIILPNTLSEGNSYTFQVEGGAEITGKASIKIKTAKALQIGKCETVESGWSLLEKRVDCEQLQHEGLSPNYDYYDTFTDSKDKGRLIASSKLNIASNIEFTRGQLVVEVTDQSGITTVTRNAEEIFPKGKFINSVNELLSYLKQDGFNLKYMTNAMTIIVDTIAFSNASFEEAPKMLEDLLVTASKQNINNLPGLKMMANCVEILANEAFKSRLSTRGIKSLSEIVVKLSQAFYKEHNYILSVNINDITTSQMLLLSQTIINICNIIHLSGDGALNIAQINEEDSYMLHSSFRESAVNMMTSIEEVISSLTLKILPHVSPTVIKGNNISIWIREGTPHSFYMLSKNQTNKDAIPYIVISQTLAKSLSQTSNFVVFQMVDISGNPFWWNNDFNIITNTVDLKIGVKNKYNVKHYTNLQYPIQIDLDYMNYEKLVIKGSFKQPAPKESADSLHGLAIHRVEMDKKGKLKLMFLNLEDGEVIRVLVLKNFRPDQEAMLAMSENISKSSPIYIKDISDPTSEDGFDLYYIGLLQGPQVAVGQLLSYRFEMEIMHCGSWHHTGWSTLGCQVKNIFPEKLLCECDHLSVFGGFLTVPMNTVDPLQDYRLLLTLTDNPFVAIFVICLLAIFLILLLCTIKKDFNDKKRQCAIYLEDNIVDDEFPYLTVVYTGSRLFAGTTSNVGLRIHGQDNLVSRAHILKSGRFKTMQRGDDNWFILYTPEFLGEITKLHLWTDLSGDKPDWYCEKIIVIDLKTKHEYTFFIKSWFSVKKGERIETFVTPDIMEERVIIEDFVSDNLKLGFREAHVWMSVVAKHPRSAVNTTQRLTVAFSGLFVTLLVSCMFYGVLDPNVEDDFEYSFTEKQIMVGICSMMISAFLINIVITLFRKRVSYHHFEELGMEESDSFGDINAIEHEEHSNVAVEKSISEQKNQQEKLSKDFHQNLIKFQSTKSNLVQMNKETGTNNEKVKIRNNVFKRHHTGNLKQKRVSNFLRFYTSILDIFVAKKKFLPVQLEVDVTTSYKKSGTMRFCFSLLPWFACVILITICAYLVVLFGLKFGKVKSEEWLSSAATSLSEGIFVITPVKIIIIAIMSASIQRKVYDAVNYNINWHKLATYRKSLLKTNPDSEPGVFILRYQKMYRPLSNTEILENKNKQEKVDMFWKIVQISVIGLIPLMLILHSDTLWATRYYWQNHSFTSLFKRGNSPEGIDINKLTNITQYMDLIKNQFLPLMYKSKWYNAQSQKQSTTEILSSKVYSSDFKTHVGLPRLYQLRHKAGLCKEPIFRNLPDSCPSRLTTNTEDDDIYGEGWRSTGVFGPSSETSPWKPLESVDVAACGYSGQKYLAGGYAADLALGLIATGEIITDLKEEDWLDRYTSVVLFEQTFYNVNSGAISQLVSVTESFHIGKLMHTAVACTINNSYEFPLIDVILFLSLCVFAVRTIIQINRKGLEKAMLSISNICDVVITFFSLFYILLHIKHSKILSSHLKQYKNRKQDEYFYFLNLTVYLDYIQLIFIIITVTVTGRCIENLSAITNETVKKFVIILINTCRYLLWIIFCVCLLFFILWRCTLYLLNSFIYSRSFLMILHPMDFKQTLKHCTGHYCMISSFILSGVSYTVTLTIIMYCLRFYRKQNYHMKKKRKSAQTMFFLMPY